MEVCSVPSTPAAERAFCGLEGSQSKRGGGPGKRSGKGTVTAWTRGVAMKIKKTGWSQETVRG